MPEPTTTSATALAGGLITVAGVATGLPADLFLPGFVGSIWALRKADEVGIAWRIVQVCSSTLLAAWCATPATLVADAIVPGIERIPADMLRYPVALVIGWAGIAGLLEYLGEKIGAARK